MGPGPLGRRGEHWGNTMTIDRRFRTRALTGAGAAALLVAAGCDLGTRARVLPVEPNGLAAVDVVAGDVDGDGALDLVATTMSGYAVAIADGDGDFAVTTTATPGSAGGSAALGDVDGDGDLDLVHGARVASGPGHVAVRPGDGDGGFAASPVVLPADRAIATAPVLGDVDGDGDLDVIAGTASDAYDMQAVIWDNRGGGTFGPATPVAELDVPFTDLLAGDVDGDGRLDLVAGMYYEAYRRVAVLRGTATGFAAPEYHETGLYELDSTLRLALADVDGDDDVDVVGTNGRQVVDGSPTLFTLLNDGAGGFGPAVTSSAPVGERAWWTTAVAVADLDGDGHADLATDQAVLFGSGDGTFGGSEPGDARSVAGGREVVAADVGGDARPDAAYVARSSVVVLINALG